LVMHYNFPIIISLFALRFIIQLIVFGKVMKTLNQRDLLLISPFTDLVLPFITLTLSVSNLLVKPQTWK